MGIEKKAASIIAKMHNDKAQGVWFPHLRAFLNIVCLLINRVTASFRLQRIKRFTCDICVKTRPHTHTKIRRDDPLYELNSIADIKWMLNFEFGVNITVSNMLFGKTINVESKSAIDQDTKDYIRQFLHIQGLTILPAKAAKRNCIAVIQFD